jgi:hypothetical protein
MNRARMRASTRATLAGDVRPQGGRAQPLIVAPTRVTDLRATMMPGYYRLVAARSVRHHSKVLRNPSSSPTLGV